MKKEKTITDMKLVLLDTNIIMDIIDEDEKHTMFLKLFINFFVDKHLYAFSIYSLYEIFVSSEERWEKFLNMFADSFFLAFQPYKSIIEYEYKIYKGEKVKMSELFFSFSLKNQKAVGDLEQMLEEMKLQKTDYDNLAKFLDEIRKNQTKKFHYDVNQEKKAVLNSLESQGVLLDSDDDYVFFPSVRVHNLSIVRRLKDKDKKEIRVNDFFDSLISYCVPYVDVVIVDNEQGNILKQAKKRIKSLDDLEILNITDISNLDLS